MKFRQIEAFYWLVQLRSYKRVADQLNITQPAVTARITTLEDALGFHLIDRSAPQFALTERGTELYGYAEAFVKLRDQMDASMRATQRRRFAIGVVGIIALTWGPLLREAVTEQFPELIVDFHYAFSDSEMRERVRPACSTWRSWPPMRSSCRKAPTSPSSTTSVGWVVPTSARRRASRSLRMNWASFP